MGPGLMAWTRRFLRVVANRSFLAKNRFLIAICFPFCLVLSLIDAIFVRGLKTWHAWARSASPERGTSIP
jgi:hypothetical protein